MNSDIEALSNLNRDLEWDSKLYYSYGYTDPASYGGEKVWMNVSDAIHTQNPDEGLLTRQFRQTFGSTVDTYLRRDYLATVPQENKNTREAVLLHRKRVLSAISSSIASIRSIIERFADTQEPALISHANVDHMYAGHIQQVEMIENDCHLPPFESWSREALAQKSRDYAHAFNRVQKREITPYENTQYARVVHEYGRGGKVLAYAIAERVSIEKVLSLSSCNIEQEFEQRTFDVLSAGCRQGYGHTMAALMRDILQRMQVVGAVELRDCIDESHVP